MVSRQTQWLGIRDEGLPLEERRLLHRHVRVVWVTALALYAAGLVAGYLIDPPQDGRLRWLAARLFTFVLVVLVVGVVTRLIFSQRIARQRDLNARLAGEDFTQLQNALRAREELDRETELLVKSVTHDLRGPLTTIKGYAQMLQRQTARSEPALGARGLQRIEGAASRAAAMLDELRDLPQLKAGGPMQLRYERLDLLALVREVVGEYEHATSGHIVRLESSLEALEGEWDRARVARVLGNLLSNAIKYSPDGSRIVVDVARAREAGREWAVIGVRDEGLGISNMDLGHVFEPFYRGSHATGPIEGSGIGLTSARWIVEQHGGTISVESQPGVGSTFTVRLPVTPEAQLLPVGLETDAAAADPRRDVQAQAPVRRPDWSALPRRWAPRLSTPFAARGYSFR